MVLRYSATHKTEHNKIHRLDALDAYNQKLVKKIAVRGITVKGLAGTNAYLYLRRASRSRQGASPRRGSSWRCRPRQARSSGRCKRARARATTCSTSPAASSQYRGFVVADIDANRDTVELHQRRRCSAPGEADRRRERGRRCDASRSARRSRRTSTRSSELFAQGIKVLSLFFIDEVAKYRDYDRDGQAGEYARVFEEEYEAVLDEVPRRAGPRRGTTAYQQVPARRSPSRKTHEGYFSIDKKTKRLVDPTIADARRRTPASPTTSMPTT